MLNLWHDGRSAVKSLAKAPGLTAMALACLVVGLGATLSMLTLTGALLIRQPPFPEADRLVRVWAQVEGVSPRYGLFRRPWSGKAYVPMGSGFRGVSKRALRLQAPGSAGTSATRPIVVRPLFTTRPPSSGSTSRSARTRFQARR